MSWNSSPLRNKIIIALIKRGGEIIDDDLARLVKSEEYVSDEVFQKELMALEIQGIVHISQITKTRKRVKLINKDRLNPQLFR